MKEHKYLELADKLCKDIREGIYTSEQKLPSENELAKITGYSRQTIRQAMGVIEDKGYIRRVRGSGTYVQSSKEKRRTTHNIAVVTTYIGEYIFPDILHGIEAVLTENGYTPMLNATYNRVDNERKILSGLLKKPIDGLIVEGTKTALPNPNIDLYSQFEELGIAVVFINGFYPDIEKPIYVVADDLAGGREACSILLKKGHKHIAGIFKSDDIQGHRRYAGYQEALRMADHLVEDDHVMWYTTENRDKLLENCTLDVIKDCTALICYNDEVALNVLKVLDKSGIKAPRDLDIVSFDNSVYARLFSNTFLSLSNPKERIGRLAAEKMIHILQDKKEFPSILPWSIK